MLITVKRFGATSHPGKLTLLNVASSPEECNVTSSSSFGVMQVKFPHTWIHVLCIAHHMTILIIIKKYIDVYYYSLDC